MTMTIDISPETEAWLAEEAQKRGQSREIVATLMLDAFASKQRGDAAERAEFVQWKGASSRVLQEYWINDADAIYDTL